MSQLSEKCNVLRDQILLIIIQGKFRQNNTKGYLSQDLNIASFLYELASQSPLNQYTQNSLQLASLQLATRWVQLISMPVLDSMGVAWAWETTPAFASKPFWPLEGPTDLKEKITFSRYPQYCLICTLYRNALQKWQHPRWFF